MPPGEVPFEFATATRIVFGSGTLGRIGSIARDFGRRAWVVTGRDPRRASKLLGLLRDAGVETWQFSTLGEPDFEGVRAAAEAARGFDADVVIGLGGGSVMDLGKVVAALLRNPGDPMDYAEVVGGGQSLTRPAAPFIAIPTTAGSGAEVTRNAVLVSREHRVKVSLRSAFLLPRVALVDPELTWELPAALTASTGLDALTQLIEPYLCRRANPITDGFCLAGIPRVARSLRKACVDGLDGAARANMAFASLWGGSALANSGLGAVHGFAAPIGAMVPAPHGAICAVLLPLVLEANLEALARAPRAQPLLGRFQEIAALLSGDREAAPARAVEWIGDLVRSLSIPALGTYGLTAAQIPEVVGKAAKSSSMGGNPVELGPEELAGILARAI